MQMTEQQKPLWVVIDNASWDRIKQGPYAPQDIRAAELRAIAREIAKRDPDDTMSALAVEEWLLAEAERAEKGE
jgi:hypothetical protein